MEHSVHPFVEFISGKTLRQLLVQEHWYADELNDPANVLFAELDKSRWVRVFFDAGVFFWSLVDTPDPPRPGGENRYSLTDCGTLGMVAHATLIESFSAALLEIRLADGRIFQLHNNKDRSWIEQRETNR